MNPRLFTRAGIRCAPLVALVFLALPADIRAQETQDTMKLAAELRTSRSALASAFSALDAARATTHFADDAVVEFGDQVMTGKPAITQWLTGTLTSLSALRTGTPTFTVAAAEVSERNTYVAVTTDGSEQPGSTIMVWKLANGAWKVTRMTVH